MNQQNNLRSKVNCQRSIVSQEGYVVLLTVLIVGAVAVGIATTLLISSIDAARSAEVEEWSRRARGMADGCVEEALEQIRDASNFSGYGKLTLGSDVCSYNVTNLGGTNRQINASSTVGTVVRKAKAILDKVKPINITSWQDVIDF